MTADRRALGQYMTPAPLVQHALDVAGVDRLPPEARVLEPACGDGAFLVGLVERRGRDAARLALEGWEIDPDATDAARRRLARALEVHAGLAPAAARRRAKRAVKSGDFLAPGAPGRGYDLALGNPPFLEAKRMPRELKARLRRDHPEWTRGAFDLFVPFVGVAARSLGEGGRLSFVLPNKVCIAAYARGLRRVLLEDLALTHLTDLSTSGAFEGAAVYPVVLAAARRARGRVTLARGASRDRELVFRRLGALDRAVYRDGPDQVLFTLPASRDERAEVEALLAPPVRLGELLDVRWTVSFHRRGLRDRYLFDHRPDSPHARPLLGAGRWQGNTDVRRYHLEWRGWWIDYDRARARDEGNPLPDARLFDAPKIVICQNARRLRAARDPVGYVLKDTFFAAHLTPFAREAGVSPAAVLAVLNSEVIHRWYRAVFGMTQVNGGYLHFLRAYLQHLPAPPVSELTRGWDRLVGACERAAARGEDALVRPGEQVEAKVRVAFGLS